MGSLTHTYTFDAYYRPEEAVQHFNFVLLYDDQNLNDQLDLLASYIIHHQLSWEEWFDQEFHSLAPTVNQQLIINDIVTAAKRVFTDCHLSFKPFEASRDLLILSTEDFQKARPDNLTLGAFVPTNGKILIKSSLDDCDFSHTFAHELAHFQGGVSHLWRQIDKRLVRQGVTAGFQTIQENNHTYLRLNEGVAEFLGFVFRSFYFQSQEHQAWYDQNMCHVPESVYIKDILLNPTGNINKAGLAKLLKAYRQQDHSIWRELIPNNHLREGLINSQTMLESAQLIKKYDNLRFNDPCLYE